jgi:hypothetical protein
MRLYLPAGRRPVETPSQPASLKLQATHGGPAPAHAPGLIRSSQPFRPVLTRPVLTRPALTVCPKLKRGRACLAVSPQRRRGSEHGSSDRGSPLQRRLRRIDPGRTGNCLSAGGIFNRENSERDDRPHGERRPVHGRSPFVFPRRINLHACNRFQAS